MAGIQNADDGEKAYSDDFSDEELENDGVGLVLKEDSDSKTSRTRKYVVSENHKIPKRLLPSWCRLSRLSRSERICLVVGLVILIVLVLIFIAVVIVATPRRAQPAPAGSGDSGSGEPGGGDGGSGDMAQAQWASVRLQTSVIPDTYDIHMSVDLDTFLVVGSVNISCTVQSSTDYIALHAKDMTISDHHVMRGSDEMKHKAVLFPENEFFVFDLANIIEPGAVNLYLSFNYTLRESLAGFYRSSYVNANGDTVFLATTQFEPTDARVAFPCFDEPSMKANFTMHMTHQSRYKAWFNMPLTSREEISDSLSISHFQTSVKMSTYLVAFIVSDFECVNETILSISRRDILVREVHTRCMHTCTRTPHGVLTHTHRHHTMYMLQWNP